MEPRPPDDFPPRTVETFEAQTLTAERERLMINFATAFEDPEGRPLRYSAESSDVSVLTAAMSGSVLTIKPLAEGSATVYGTGYEAASLRFHHSRWQRQDEFGWTTLPGTVRGKNKLCVYTLSSPGCTEWWEMLRLVEMGLRN
ncbi:MAG: hypothetical protein OXU48_00330 [candidate division Zixibacteria bacterium]|nr:hypothetical protein [candidate division Zixibacteria bacterium]